MIDFASTGTDVATKALSSFASNLNRKVLSADTFVKNRPLATQLIIWGGVTAVIGTVALVNAAAPVVINGARALAETTKSLFGRTTDETTIDGEFEEIIAAE